MHALLRNLIRHLPGRRRPPPAAVDLALARPWPSTSDRRAVFSYIHQHNHWGDPESVSGPGSTLAHTRNIRETLPRLWKQLGIRVVLDAPCGDFNWFRAMDRPSGLRYIGGDIVEALVAANQHRYGDASTAFQVMDIISDPLPHADFWLCRECLFHLPSKDVLTVLRRFATSTIPYLCTTTHHECPVNTEIHTGTFSPLNLEKPPYNLPRARFYMDDWIEGTLPRRLGVWHRTDVASALGIHSE